MMSKKSPNKVYQVDAYTTNDSDWKTQTFQKMYNENYAVEPIIENPGAEGYGTASRHKMKRKRSNFNKFYDKEMNFVHDKYSNLAYEQAKKNESEVGQYQNIRNSMHLMSKGSRKLLHNRVKSSMINNEVAPYSKINNKMGTPVHQRLFADNENRQKRIEELKQEYQDGSYEGIFLNESHSRKNLIKGGKFSFIKSNLNSYKSVENLNHRVHKTSTKISDTLGKRLVNKSEARSYKSRAANRFKRHEMPYSMVINNDVSNKLYEDAKRRQSDKKK